MIDDTVLLSMFKDQEGEGGRGGRSHSHQAQSNNWQEINGFHLQNSTSFSEYQLPTTNITTTITLFTIHHHINNNNNNNLLVKYLFVRF